MFQLKINEDLSDDQTIKWLMYELLDNVKNS